MSFTPWEYPPATESAFPSTKMLLKALSLKHFCLTFLPLADAPHIPTFYNRPTCHTNLQLQRIFSAVCYLSFLLIFIPRFHLPVQSRHSKSLQASWMTEVNPIQSAEFLSVEASLAPCHSFLRSSHESSSPAIRHWRHLLNSSSSLKSFSSLLVNKKRPRKFFNHERDLHSDGIDKEHDDNRKKQFMLLHFPKCLSEWRHGRWQQKMGLMNEAVTEVDEELVGWADDVQVRASKNSKVASKVHWSQPARNFPSAFLSPPRVDVFFLEAALYGKKWTLTRSFDAAALAEFHCIQTQLEEDHKECRNGDFDSDIGMGDVSHDVIGTSKHSENSQKTSDPGIREKGVRIKAEKENSSAKTSDAYLSNSTLLMHPPFVVPWPQKCTSLLRKNLSLQSRLHSDAFYSMNSLSKSLSTFSLSRLILKKFGDAAAVFESAVKPIIGSFHRRLFCSRPTESSYWCGRFNQKDHQKSRWWHPACRFRCSICGKGFEECGGYIEIARRPSILSSFPLGSALFSWKSIFSPLVTIASHKRLMRILRYWGGTLDDRGQDGQEKDISLLGFPSCTPLTVLFDQSKVVYFGHGEGEGIWQVKTGWDGKHFLEMEIPDLGENPPAEEQSPSHHSTDYGSAKIRGQFESRDSVHSVGGGSAAAGSFAQINMGLKNDRGRMKGQKRSEIIFIYRCQLHAGKYQQGAVRFDDGSIYLLDRPFLPWRMRKVGKFSLSYPATKGFVEASQLQ